MTKRGCFDCTYLGDYKEVVDCFSFSNRRSVVDDPEEGRDAGLRSDLTPQDDVLLPDEGRTRCTDDLRRIYEPLITHWSSQFIKLGPQLIKHWTLAKQNTYNSVLIPQCSTRSSVWLSYNHFPTPRTVLGEWSFGCWTYILELAVSARCSQSPMSFHSQLETYL